MSGSNRKRRQMDDQDLTEGAQDAVRSGGLAVLEKSLNLAQATAAGRKEQPLGWLVKKEPSLGLHRLRNNSTELRMPLNHNCAQLFKSR